MKSTAFGLDIGSTTIKVVWLDQREKNAFVYHSSFVVPTPPQGMQSESPFDHQEMAQFINKLVIDANITTNNVNIALPENRVYTKVIDMPVLSEKELQSAIYWEAEQYIPAPLDTMTFDWTILRKPHEAVSEQKMQVLLVAAPLQLIKRYQTILELAGLSIASVETETLSVVRGILPKNYPTTSLIMNIGAMTSTFCIVQKGVIVFTYFVPLGGLAMTRAIAADFGFSPQQAEEYKRVYGLADKNFGSKIIKALEPILTSMLSELKKAIAFYNDKYKNESLISQILLTGGSAGLPGIGVYFTQNIGIETVIANPWKMLNIQSVPADVDRNGTDYSVAVGLALKEYE